MPRSFTQKPLTDHDGQAGNPGYVAVDGEVYDVSKSAMWKDGTHMGRHQAGHDLTAELTAAPHGKEVLARDHIAQMGMLASADPDERLPKVLRWVLGRFPIVRRHLHPMTVHFPTAFFMAAALFTFIHLIWPNWLNVDFAMLATAMFVMGVVCTPMAIVTGLFTWWVNYAFGLNHHVRRKLIFSATLLLAVLVCLLIKLSGAGEHPVARWMDAGLTFWLAINVMILGYYGGHIVFPTQKSQGRSKKS